MILACQQLSNSLRGPGLQHLKPWRLLARALLGRRNVMAMQVEIPANRRLYGPRYLLTAAGQGGHFALVPVERQRPRFLAQRVILWTVLWKAAHPAGTEAASAWQPWRTLIFIHTWPTCCPATSICI